MEAPPDMDRRTVLIGLPIVAGGLVAGTAVVLYRGQSSDALPALALPEPGAPVPAAPGPGQQGALLIQGDAFPGAANPLQPSETIDEACLNGDQLSICLSHTAQGRRRILWIALRQDRAWEAGTLNTFDCADTAGVEATLHNLPEPGIAGADAASYHWRIAKGRIQARLLNSTMLELTMAPEAGADLVATPWASSSVNAAKADVRVLHTTPAASRTLLVRMGIEREATV